MTPVEFAVLKTREHSRQAEGGTKVADICRKHGISKATFYIRKKKYSALA